jgi:Skp family chaperone for outer membrane proteins
MNLNMRKFFFIAILLFVNYNVLGQAKGTRIGYIDMEYILGKLPNYQETLNSLEQKASEWKGEIDKKNADIKILKDALNTERVLLTKDLVAEREEEIKFLEDELVDYQQKRFGPEGDLIVMRSSLVKPVQDMVFNIVQDVADKRGYDFILDKSSDLTVLFAKKNLDLSDYVVRAINRSLKGEKLSKKELEKIEKEEEDKLQVKSPQQEEREKRLEEKRAERQKMIDDRNAAKEAKKAELEARRNKTGSSPAAKVKEPQVDENGETNAERLKRENEEKKALKKQEIEDKKREAAEKRQQLIDDRNKAKEDKAKSTPKTLVNDSNTPKETPKSTSGTNFENGNNTTTEASPDTPSETPLERKKRENAERLELRKQDIERRKQEAKEKREAAALKAKENKKTN